jgi:hypothetical protein
VTTPRPELEYAVVVEIPAVSADAEPGVQWVEGWPATASGAITATNRACQLSWRHQPHEVRNPAGRMIARYENGRRADLPAGGLIRLADAKLASDLPTGRIGVHK